MQPELEKIIKSEERPNSLSRRDFIKKIIKGGVALGVASSVSSMLLSEPSKKITYDISIKEYDGLTQSLANYESVRKDVATAVRNINSLRGAAVSSEELNQILEKVKIEPITEAKGTQYMITANFESQAAREFMDFFEIVNKAKPKILSWARSGKNNAINPHVKEGYYIQLSANKNEANMLNNIEILKKLGFKNVVLNYDSRDKVIKFLIGGYSTTDQATSQAEKLLLQDDVLDALENNELGIVNAWHKDDQVSLEWEKIVKEVKILKKQDKKAYTRLEQRAEKRNVENKKIYRKAYSIKEIESIIAEGVNKHNAKNKDKIDLDFAKAIAYCESTYNPYAIGYGIVSKIVKNKDGSYARNKGGSVARRNVKVALGHGLFQMLPSTANSMGVKNYSDEELFNPVTNTELGLGYVSYLMNLGAVKEAKSPAEKMKLLLAAYNGGEKAVQMSDTAKLLGKKQRAFENEMNRGYRETRNYVNKVMAQYNEFKSHP